MRSRNKSGTRSVSDIASSDCAITSRSNAVSRFRGCGRTDLQLGSLLHLRLVNGDEPLASAPLQEVEAVVDLDTPEPCLKTRSPLETRQSGEARPWRKPPAPNPPLAFARTFVPSIDSFPKRARPNSRARRTTATNSSLKYSILVALDEDLERSEIVTGGASCRLDLVDESRVVYRRFL